VSHTNGENSQDPANINKHFLKEIYKYKTASLLSKKYKFKRSSLKDTTIALVITLTGEKGENFPDCLWNIEHQKSKT
jgi:hypothetical protein